MEDYLQRLGNKLSKHKLRGIFNKYHTIIENDLLLNIIKDVIDALDDFNDDEHEVYKGHDITYIKKKVKDKSDHQGLDLTTRVIVHYVDIIMPLNTNCFNCDKTDDDIINTFVINTDGAQIDNNHSISDYQKLIDTQSKTVLINILKESSSTKALNYYIGDQTSDVIDVIQTLTYIRDYHAVINQTPELTDKLFNLANKYSDHKEWIFHKIRNITSSDMCKLLVMKDVDNIRWVPRHLRTQEMYCMVAHCGCEIVVKRCLCVEDLNLEICRNIAGNTHWGFDEWDCAFNDKLGFIPNKYQNIGVYYNLIKNIKGWHRAPQNNFLLYFEKIPKEYRKKIFDKLNTLPNFQACKDKIVLLL